MRIYEFHPLSEFFPMLPEQQFKELKESIREIGQREPLVLYEGKILDGRNRYQACVELEIEPKVENHNGNVPAIALVIAANLRRRHLTGPERVAILRKIYPPTKQGDGSPRKKGETKSDRTGDISLEAGTPTTRKKIADLAGSSTKTVERFDELERDAPDLAEQVEKGQTTLHKARREQKRRKARGTWRYGKDIPPILDSLKVLERWGKTISNQTLDIGKPLHHDAAQYIGNKLDGIIAQLQELRDELKGMERNA